MLDRYYQRGKAVKFWSTQFYRDTEEARREKIYQPRAQLVFELVKNHRPGSFDTFLDVGSGYGIFLEEVAKLGVFRTVIGIEPAPNMAEVARQKGFAIIEKPVEFVAPRDAQADIATTFEVLEHVFSPLKFLRSIHRILKKDGILVYTTLTISGFDLQVLWDRSKSIYPPHHINLISVEGMQRLIEKAGYKLVELTTPGKLDVDIVINSAREDARVQLPRFIQYLLEKRSEETHLAFQTFLQQNNLSSHIRCIVKKRA